MDIFDIIGPVMDWTIKFTYSGCGKDWIYIPEVDGRTDKGSKYFAVWFFS